MGARINELFKGEVEETNVVYGCSIFRNFLVGAGRTGECADFYDVCQTLVSLLCTNIHRSSIIYKECTLVQDVQKELMARINELFKGEVEEHDARARGRRGARCHFVLG